nr:immunoglobulin light chain junction region [Macaca mulatta]MOX47711.1 immunoglobulin light chain junction region [Macaca mulatta]MOX47802.1 immunoglobulin light chain junction region [Macaca mulatta]MOX47843.1 immunoglobulin light chain junction region [Macaca mulatta]MOX47884.1 immunoglobulin light chain junction region [Macaca mulatta]
CQETSNVALTF